MHTVKSNCRWLSRPKSTSSLWPCSKLPSSASSTTKPRSPTRKSRVRRVFQRNCLRLRWWSFATRRSNCSWSRTLKNQCLKMVRRSRLTHSSTLIRSVAILSHRKLSKRRLQKPPLRSLPRRSKSLARGNSSCKPTQSRSWKPKRPTDSRIWSPMSSETLQCSARTLRWSRSR